MLYIILKIMYHYIKTPMLDSGNINEELKLIKMGSFPVMLITTAVIFTSLNVFTSVAVAVVNICNYVYTVL